MSDLDTWVFDKVKAFFAEAMDNVDLQMELRKDKTVFFLHLLGCDSNGHAHRPGSKEYEANALLVDNGIAEIADLIESYWRHDDKTTFVFTADHGMTDWGSHGAGTPDETEVLYLLNRLKTVI